MGGGIRITYTKPVHVILIGGRGASGHQGSGNGSADLGFAHAGCLHLTDGCSQLGLLVLGQCGHHGHDFGHGIDNGLRIRIREGETGQNIYIGVFFLGLHCGRVADCVDQVLHQFAPVADHTDGSAGNCIRIGFDHAHNSKGFRLGKGVQHKEFILFPVMPDSVGFLVIVAFGDQFEGHSQKILEGEGMDLTVQPDVFTVGLLLHGLTQFFHIQKSQGIQAIVADAVLFVYNKNQFIPFFRKSAFQNLILSLQKFVISGESGENVLTHHRVAAHSHFFHHTGGVDPPDTAGGVAPVDVQRGGIAVSDFGGECLQAAFTAFDECLEVRQVVGGGTGEHHFHHSGHNIGGINGVFSVLRQGALRFHGTHHTGHIHGVLLEGQGIVGQRVPFHIGDVEIDTGGNTENQSDAHNADGAGKGGHECAALFGHQIAEGQHKGGKDGHGGPLTLAGCGFRSHRLRAVIGVGIG